MSRAGTARLDASVIVDAALELLRRYGLGDLSMRRLAKELDVQPSALYWHISSKQELLAQLSRTLLRPLETLRGPAMLHLLALNETLLQVRDGAEVVAAAWAHHPDLLPTRALLDALEADLPAERAALIAETAVLAVLAHTQQGQMREALHTGTPEDLHRWQDRLMEGLTLIVPSAGTAEEER